MTRRGRGTYGQIIQNIADAQDIDGLSFFIRVNVSSSNLLTLDGLLDHLTRELSPTNVSIYFSPVLDLGVNFTGAPALTEMLAEQLIAATVRAIRDGFMVPLPVEEVVCPQCSIVANDTSATIAPDGRLYSCWETAGRPEWDVGDIKTGFHSRVTLESRWARCGSIAEGAMSFGTWQRHYADRRDHAVLEELRDIGKLDDLARSRARLQLNHA